MAEPKFNVGQLVVATGSYNWLLTEGKQYVVIKYEPEYYDLNFTLPAYVTVIGDSGKPVTGHTHRFRAVEDAEPVQYISDATPHEVGTEAMKACWKFTHDT